MTRGVGIAAGLVIGLAIAACAAKGASPQPKWQIAMDKKQEITALWTQIRDWRREAHMEVEPSTAVLQYARGMTVRQAAETCPDSHVPPPSCNDICDLADAICDNAENICGIAGEMPDDIWAREKCDSAKASCKEAKQHCCSCDDDATKAARAEDIP
jgi:hypothetical protein